jgi:hypothetical protein
MWPGRIAGSMHVAEAWNGKVAVPYRLLTGLASA